MRISNTDVKSAPITVKFVTEEELTMLKASTLNIVAGDWFALLPRIRWWLRNSKT